MPGGTQNHLAVDAPLTNCKQMRNKHTDKQTNQLLSWCSVVTCSPAPGRPADACPAPCDSDQQAVAAADGAAVQSSGPAGHLSADAAAAPVGGDAEQDAGARHTPGVAGRRGTITADRYSGARLGECRALRAPSCRPVANSRISLSPSRELARRPSPRDRCSCDAR